MRNVRFFSLRAYVVFAIALGAGCDAGPRNDPGSSAAAVFEGQPPPPEYHPEYNNTPTGSGPTLDLDTQRAAWRETVLTRVLAHSTQVARVRAHSSTTITEIVVIDPNGVPEALGITYTMATIDEQVLGNLPPQITIRHMLGSCGPRLDGDAIVFLEERSGYFQLNYGLDVKAGSNVTFEGEVLSLDQFLGRL